MNENKKYYVMGGSIIAVIFVLLISMMLLSSCNKKNSYSKIENKLVKAAEKAVTNGDVTIEPGSSMVVTADQLTEAGYIKSLDKLKNDNCSGYVTIMNNNNYYNYVPSLTCTNYHTVTLKEKIIEDNLTVKKAGLYAVDGEYVFKGQYPNNHVKFNNGDWLIIKIDSNGILKLVSLNEQKQTVYWDNKFNTDTNSRTGENEFESSNMYEMLKNKYASYKVNDVKHLVPYNICISKRSMNNIVSNSSADCSETLEGQYLGLISPSDYANASYDPDCQNILSGSCINYNYLFETLSETWTTNAIADNSYEVILYDAGRIKRVSANERHYYNLVIYISGDELYTSGNGTIDDPYVIK